MSGTVTPSGSLRTYLGIAPGVGKTYAMLAEGHRRADAGERVVIGWIERHGRAGTRAQVGDLEIIAPRTLTYRGGTFADLDVEAVIASSADVALIDELAHSAPGTGRERWQDVADILAAGIDVLTTTNVANLRSVRDYAARITGVGAVESVPDEFVRSGEVVLLDMPADALRRRIAVGNVYSTEQVGGALAEYFRVSNLEALSELGRAWIAGEVDRVATELLARRGLVEQGARPLVVAGVSGSRRGEAVIRTAAELAREDDADLVVVHVNVTDGMSSRRRAELEKDRRLAKELGGTYRQIEGTHPVRSLAAFAAANAATRVVVGHKKSRLKRSTRRSVAKRLRKALPQLVIDEAQEQEMVAP